MITKVQASIPPSIEVILHVDGAGRPLVVADGPILTESLSTIDRRLIVASRDVDVVASTVRLQLTLVLCTLARIVGSVVFNNVILDEGVASPSVDAEVSVTLWGKVSAIVDGAITVSESS